MLMLESLQSSQKKKKKKKRKKKKRFVLCTYYLFDKCLIDVFIIGMIYFFGVCFCSHQIQVLGMY